MAEFDRPESSPHQPRPDSSRSPERSGFNRLEALGGAGRAGAVAERAGDLASQFAGQAAGQVQDWAAGAAGRAEDLFQDVSRWVRRNPVPALLIVGGLGVLLAVALTAAARTESESRSNFYGR